MWLLDYQMGTSLGNLTTFCFDSFIYFTTLKLSVNKQADVISTGGLLAERLTNPNHDPKVKKQAVFMGQANVYIKCKVNLLK